MRAYSAASMEDLRARKLLGEWRNDRLLTDEQYEELEQESTPERVGNLRTTNVFLRVVLFLFTLVCVGAMVGLFFALFRLWTEQISGVFLLIVAAFCYGSAEVAVSQGEMYRHGVEEALAVSSVGYLCMGLNAFLHLSGQYGTTHLIAGVGATASLWVWHRFQFWYAFPAAMIFAVFVAGDWAFLLGGSTGPQMGQRVLLAALYGVGLIAIRVLRPRHRLDYLDREYSMAEALLWLGLYLAINLKIVTLGNPVSMWVTGTRSPTEFPTTFYWATWALTWCVPPVVLMRGVVAKDRFVLGVGLTVTVLTFITNKPYFAWARHTWDPMLLGVFLTGGALYLRGWLASGTGGIRHGFTAARLSGRDSRRIHLGASLIGLVTPYGMTPSAQKNPPEFKFGGGASGGGGVTGDF